MTLTQTEQEALRIAIAEEMGWEFQQGTEPTYGGTCKNTGWFYSNDKWKTGKDSHPPYTTSLDAIQAAALERFNEDEIAIDEFNYQLSMEGSNMRPIKEVWQLTALDWCIAFARTSKIWRFK